MPQIQEFWNKLNPRERLTTWGALAVAVGWIIGLTASYGLGGNTVALVGAIVVVIILWLKYAPNQNITWPAPVPLIILGISAIVALGALLGLINFLQLMGLAGAFGGFFAGAILAAIVTAVGGGLMVWGAWQEYQLTAPASSAGGSGSAPPPPPPAAPTMPPPAGSNTDDQPPA